MALLLSIKAIPPDTSIDSGLNLLAVDLEEIEDIIGEPVLQADTDGTVDPSVDLHSAVAKVSYTISSAYG